MLRAEWRGSTHATGVDVMIALIALACAVYVCALAFGGAS